MITERAIEHFQRHYIGAGNESKDHECCYCGGNIPAGVGHETIVAGPEDGCWFYHAHVDCHCASRVALDAGGDLLIPRSPADFFFAFKDCGFTLPLHAALEVRRWDGCAEFSDDGKLLSMF